MSSFYGRTNATLARVFATLDRVADIHDQIAERRQREALGLLPQYTPPPPPEPTQEAEDAIDGERPMTLAQFEGVMLELMVHLRGEISAVRDEVQALAARRRRRKGKATATTATEDRSDDHTS